MYYFTMSFDDRDTTYSILLPKNVHIYTENTTDTVDNNNIRCPEKIAKIQIYLQILKVYLYPPSIKKKYI